jgi:hypothetical protein
MQCMHAPMQYFQNAVAQIAAAISYEHKMFIKSTPGCHNFFFSTADTFKTCNDRLTF